MLTPKRQNQNTHSRPTIGLVLCLLFVVLFSACGGVVPPASSVSPPSATSTGSAGESGTPVALLVPEETADTPYSQAVFEKLSRAAGEVGLNSGLYRTATTDSPAVVGALELAATGGAEVVVLLGAELADTARQATLLYPEISFVLLDLQMQAPLPQNVVQIEYSSMQSGFLAGYAGVYETATHVGFLLEQNDEQSMQYAYGFLLGADTAASIRQGPDEELLAYPLSVEAEEEPLFGVDESTAQVDERSLQRKTENFFEEAGNDALLFASNAGWVQPSLEAAADHEGRVALLVEENEPYTHNAAAIQVQFDPQKILTRILELWQHSQFPGGTVQQGTVRDGDIFLYVPEGSVTWNDAAYTYLQELFQQPAENAQVRQCLSLESETELPPIESLSLDVYELDLQTPLPAPDESATDSSASHGGFTLF